MLLGDLGGQGKARQGKAERVWWGLSVGLRERPLPYLGGHVGAALKEQRDAVGEAVHGDTGLGVAPAEAHAGLYDERVAVVRARRVLQAQANTHTRGSVREREREREQAEGAREPGSLRSPAAMMEAAAAAVCAGAVACTHLEGGDQLRP